MKYVVKRYAFISENQKTTYLCLGVLKAIQAILQLHSGFIFILLLLFGLRGRRGARRRSSFCLRRLIVVHVLKLSKVVVIKVRDVLAVIKVIVVASPGDWEGQEQQQGGNQEVHTTHGGTCTKEGEKHSERRLKQQAGTL